MFEYDIKKVQNALYEMLCEFVDFLEKNKIKYFLIGGTALGAIRHEGFIPWDDDIDIAIPREDYNRLETELYKKIPSKYFFQSHYTEKNYIYNFNKIRLNNSLFLQQPLEKIKIHHGLYIDVFPLDGAGSDLSAAYKHISKIRFYNYILASRVLLHNNKKRPIIEKLKVYILCLFRLFFSKKKLLLINNKLVNKFRYSDSFFVANLMGTYSIKEVMEKNIFESNSNIRKRFVDKDFIVPSQYDKYLKNLYNNYMILPKDSSRVSHHQIIKFNLGENDYEKRNKE